MPPIYKPDSKEFDELMARVCPMPRAETLRRIGQICRRMWPRGVGSRRSAS